MGVFLENYSKKWWSLLVVGGPSGMVGEMAGIGATPPSQTGSVGKVSVVGISYDSWDSFVFSHYKS